MSVRVMSRVFDDPSIEDHGELLVMLVLADFCNDAGECWPAVGTVAKKSRIDERSVRRIFQRLLETGRLQVARGGGRETNLYRLYPTPDLGSPLTLSPPTPDLKSPHPGTRVRAPLTYGQPIRNGIIIEPSKKQQKPTRKLAADVDSVVLPLFLDTKEFRAALQHWLDHKRLKRDPMTQHAVDLLVKKCEAWGEKKAITAINLSIERGWRGVFTEEQPQLANGQAKPQKSCFVSRDMVAAWCARKGWTKLTETAWGKLMGGSYYGRPITNEIDFNAAMSAIYDETDP